MLPIINIRFTNHNTHSIVVLEQCILQGGGTMSLQNKANLLMLIVTIFWGASYTFMMLGLESLEPYNIVALRCTIAFIVAGLIFYKKMKNVNTSNVIVCSYSRIFIIYRLCIIAIRFTNNISFKCGFYPKLKCCFSTDFHKYFRTQATVTCGYYCDRMYNARHYHFNDERIFNIPKR